MSYATARDVFEQFVPQRIEGDAALAESIQAAYVFNIEGEGVWTLDFRGPVGRISEGSLDDADCFITLHRDHLLTIMENPMVGLKYLMTGQLKIAGEYSLAEHLLKLFAPLRKR